MKFGEVAAECLRSPCKFPEQVPVLGQKMRMGKFGVILAFHVGDT